MNSAIAVLIGLAIAIVLIVRKCNPVYALLFGSLVSGLTAGWGLEGTVREMITGVKNISPAIVRILAAGVLTGALIKSGSAAKISRTIVRKLGDTQVYLALSLSAFVLTAIGVFIDVAVITITPIAILVAKDMKLPQAKVLLVLVGGGKCGNIISPNPNTIVAADNYMASLPSVMLAGLIPAVIGLLVTVFVIVRIVPSKEGVDTFSNLPQDEQLQLPAFWASITGPIFSVLLLSLRPIAGIAIDPAIALPAGGLITLLATHSLKKTGESLNFGLSKMTVIAVLLVGTGTLAGVIKASALKDVLIDLLSGWTNGAAMLAPVSGLLMAAASASTTAGVTISSATFSQTVIASGVSSVWAAAMTNASATVLDHLPHGSFFHATGGALGMDLKNRLKLIPYETMVGLTLTLVSAASYFIFP